MQQEALHTIQQTGQFNAHSWNTYLLIFKKMEDYENGSGNSFDDPTPAMVIEFLNSLHSTSIHAVQKNLQIVRLYLSEIKKVDKISEVSAYQVDLTEGLRRKLSPSISDIYQRIRLIAQPNEGYCLYPALTFAWMGIPLKTAIAIKTEQVDLESGKIEINLPLTYDILNSEMRTVLKEYRTPQPKILKNGQRTTSDQNERPEFIFKMLSKSRTGRGEPIQTNFVSKKIPEIKAAYNERHITPMEMEYDDVIKSGRFARLYELECAGQDWNAPENQSLMKSIYDSERIEPGYLRHNYQMYKKAFGLK